MSADSSAPLVASVHRRTVQSLSESEAVALRGEDSSRYRHLAYRPDIDGLRAVAVLSVIGFHGFSEWLPGGFVGVDIFFVISGYLICGIIFTSLNSGGFSFLQFYARRIRRIFPALATVLIATFAIGWFCLLSDEFTLFGKHMAWGAGFAANFALANEWSYFDTGSASKPLLHLWSLGVEEQFYILWPITLFLAWVCRINLLAISIIVLIASFGLNVETIGRDPLAAFYLPAPRFWELQIGAVLAYLVIRRPAFVEWLSNVKAWLGLFLIGTALIVIDRNVAFPGWYALLPTLGAALLISAGSSAWLNRTILAQPMMVAIGLISYPLYLWHWPLFAFAHVIDGDSPAPMTAAVIVIVSVGLAWATYRFIERPIRFGPRRAIKVVGLCCAMAAIGCLGFATYSTGGFPSRPIAKAYATVVAARDDWIPLEEHFPQPYVLPGTTDDKVVFLGDSHVEQYAARVLWLYQTQKPALTAVFATAQGCPPIPDTHIRADSGRLDCDRFYAQTLKLVEQPTVRKLVIGAAWEFYIIKPPPNLGGRIDAAFAKFGEFVRSTVRRGVEVHVVLSNPTGREFDLRKLPRWKAILRGETRLQDSFVDRQAVSDTAELMRKLSDVVRSNGGHVIDPFDYICGPSLCQTIVDGSPVYLDIGHLRASVAREKATFLDDIILH